MESRKPNLPSVPYSWPWDVASWCPAPSSRTSCHMALPFFPNGSTTSMWIILILSCNFRMERRRKYTRSDRQLTERKQNLCVSALQDILCTTGSSFRNSFSLPLSHVVFTIQSKVRKRLFSIMMESCTHFHMKGIS